MHSWKNKKVQHKNSMHCVGVESSTKKNLMNASVLVYYIYAAPFIAINVQYIFI